MNQEINQKEARVMLVFANKSTIFNDANLLCELSISMIKKAVKSLHQNEYDMLYLVLGHPVHHHAVDAKRFILKEIIPPELKCRVYVAMDCRRTFADQLLLILSSKQDLAKVSLRAITTDLSFCHETFMEQVLEAHRSAFTKGLTPPTFSFDSGGVLL